MISWTGYLVAHHGETAQFVNEPGTGNAPSFPESRSERVAVAGVVSLITLAFPLGIRALIVESFFPLVTAATLFVGGYVSGHRLLTGSAV
jgi:hypothetical protein